MSVFYGSCASSNWYDIKYLTVFTHSLINVIHGTGGFIPVPVLTLLLVVIVVFCVSESLPLKSCTVKAYYGVTTRSIVSITLQKC